MKKTAIVTGADRGLGYSIVRGLLEREYVVIAGEFNSKWSKLSDINSNNLHIVPLDVIKQDTIDNMMNFAKKDFQGIDLLINNAGIINKNYTATLEETLDMEEIKQVYDVNAIGALRVCKAIVPLMKGIKRVVFISSEAGSISNCFRNSWYAYCMSKAALNMMAKIMYNDLSEKGYTFRVIHPGYVKSYMHGEINDDGEYESDDAAKIVLHTCLDLDVDENRLFMIDDKKKNVYGEDEK